MVVGIIDFDCDRLGVRWSKMESNESGFIRDFGSDGSGFNLSGKKEKRKKKKGKEREGDGRGGF